MKKGLLLSVVASGLIYAGGDIAPVEPVQPTVAPAACDFWGQIGVRLDAQKDGNGVNKFFKGDGTTRLNVVLGVEKEVGYGFGFGAEVAGLLTRNDKLKTKATEPRERAELSQLYITYKAGNTAIKVGRQALPKAVSPLAWSDRTLGVLDLAFNGVTIVNTDIQDTTLVAAWIKSVTLRSTSNNIGKNGVFMLGAINKSIENTTLSFAAYYTKDHLLPGNFVSVWAAAQTKVSSVDLGLQVAYAKHKALTKTIGVAGYIGTKYNDFDAKLTLAYINDGTTPINLGTTSGFWGGTFGGVFGGNVNAAAGKQKIARLDLGYKLPNNYGKIYGGVAADKPDNGKTAVAARVGYDFKVMDVNAKVEYRYHKDFGGVKHHRVRVQGVYKF